LTLKQQFDSMMAFKEENYRKESMRTFVFAIIVYLVCQMSYGANTNRVDVSKIEALNVISKTLYHEARSESEIGIKAVASTIHNRAMKKSGNSSSNALVYEALRRKQYSCWNGRKDLPSGSGKEWMICRAIAYQMVIGEFKPTITNTHYYAHGKVNPKWAQEVEESDKLILGNHTFLTVKW